MWLNPQTTLDWQGRPGRWLEPLLAAELLTRLAAEQQTVRWHGARTAREGYKLELTVTGAAQWQTGRVIFHLTGLTRRNVDWAGLAQNFHRSARGRKSPLPPLAVLLPDAAQAAQVSELIDRRLRQEKIRVLVTDWPALAAAPRLTEAPVWRLLRPKALALTGQTLASVASD
jgi:hypothetical protein